METIVLLSPRADGVYLDATVGGGGHAEAILEASEPSGRVIGIDRDPAAIEAAGRRLAKFGDRVQLHTINFAELDLDPSLRDARYDGAVLDLGVSSAQIDIAARGFSYRQDAPLDMRMGPSGDTARDLLARADSDSLVKIIRDFGEERHARRIADSIVRAREEKPIETTGQLRLIVENAVPGSAHPLKSVVRVFQALRIAVNDELAALEVGLSKIFRRLNRGARLAVIAYHSLEDRIVKHYFRELETECICPPDLPVCGCDKVAEGKRVNRRLVRPSQEEVENNPRARSARLRAIERRQVV